MELEFEIEEDIFNLNDINNLDYQSSLQKTKMNMNNENYEIDNDMKQIGYRNNLTPTTNDYKSKKVVMFSAFGFDKVDNLLLDSIILDEEQAGDSINRDILREINNLNYEGSVSFRYLNFT